MTPRATRRGMPLRVCIITPGQIGSNPRVVKEAQALYEAGHAVTVIATRVLDAVEPRDQAILACAPWSVRRIDLRARLPWKMRRAVQLAARLGPVGAGGPRRVALAFSVYTPPLAAAARATPADLYIAHYPAALPAAAAAAGARGVPFAYDAEDFHIGEWPEGPAHDVDRALLRAVEGRHIRACAFVTAASPGIADAYREAYGVARPSVVLNVFPLRHAPVAPTARGEAMPGPSLYWFSQTIGPGRGLECAVRALGAARTRPNLFLRGTPAGGYLACLREIAGAAGAGDRLHVLPPEAPDAMERLAARYDLGLCAEPGGTPNNAILQSNKLFTFLLAGLPPLMSDTPGQAAFAVEAGLGGLVYPAEDAAALARLVDALLSNPARLTAARAAVWRLGQDRYNWDREGDILRDLVAGHASG